MNQRRNQTSAQSGIYRATVPVPHEHRQDLRILAHEAGARSFSDLVLILVQRPEEAGRILAPLVLEVAGTHWKEQALEKVKAAAAREDCRFPICIKLYLAMAPLHIQHREMNREF